ncbi:hypothetical protein [Ornithinibacillus halophilus]|uniref:Peptidase family M50 n=1 Tax=Ornithinibacillus halophilus TaxID=930117 RepID=A0A1M5CTV0_9BACI|nr:hypothetical protein [Ornithinibacillus halophilus]SHF58106.1 hypothetical protein SAMN05216225_1001386 [Ornithinibacillus halophilus]
MDVLFWLYLLFVAIPLCTLIHESGHMLAARILKADHITLVIGRGSDKYKFSISKLQVVIRSLFLITGVTESSREKPYKRLEIIFITLCGPISNLFFFLLFLYLYMIFHNDYVFVLMLLNAWIGIVNITPFKVKGKLSDGYVIFQQIFKK